MPPSDHNKIPPWYMLNAAVFVSSACMSRATNAHPSRLFAVLGLIDLVYMLWLMPSLVARRRRLLAEAGVWLSGGALVVALFQGWETGLSVLWIGTMALGITTGILMIRTKSVEGAQQATTVRE